jgi:hypothetical protein
VVKKALCTGLVWCPLAEVTFLLEIFRIFRLFRILEQTSAFTRTKKRVSSSILKMIMLMRKSSSPLGLCCCNLVTPQSVTLPHLEHFARVQQGQRSVERRVVCDNVGVAGREEPRATSTEAPGAFQRSWRVSQDCSAQQLFNANLTQDICAVREKCTHRYSSGPVCDWRISQQA